MRVIVHIGTEKTGTTTIQALLARNRGALSERGFHVLQCAGRTNQRAIASYCMRADKRDDYLRNHLIDDADKRERFREKLRTDLAEELGGVPGSTHTVLISSEHLHSLLFHREELEKLRGLLQPHFSEIRILVYLREQVDTVLSRYSTAIKSGRTPELETALQNCVPDNIFFNHDMMLQRWEEVFGRDAIEVALFAREDLIANDLVSDFLCRLDSSLLDHLDVNIDVENESLTELGQTIGRAINLAFPKFEESIGVNPLRTRLMDINYRHFKGRGAGISEERREEISNTFVQCNERVRARYFPERDALFRSSSPPSRTDGCEPDVALALSELFLQILDDRNVVPQRYVDIFRNAAVRLEEEHLENAFELMNLASHMRPEGPLIQAKRQEYLDRLEARASGEASEQP